MIKKMFSSKQFSNLAIWQYFSRGFTLIELLVVIAIIGILATVVTINYNHAKEVSRDSKRKADLENVASAITIYYAENKAYPSGEIDWNGLATELRNKGAISTMPVDPTEDTKNGVFYHYEYNCGSETSCKNWFAVYVPLEGSENATLPNVTTQPDSTNISYGSGTYKIGEQLYYRVAGK